MQHLQDITKKQIEIMQREQLDLSNLQGMVKIQSGVIEKLLCICRDQQFKLNLLERIKVNEKFTSEEIDSMKAMVEFIVAEYVDGDDSLPVDLYDWRCILQEHSHDSTGRMWCKLEVYDKYVMDTLKNLIVEYVRTEITDKELAVAVLKSACIINEEQDFEYIEECDNCEKYEA